jgi:hypothetical protein
MHIDEAFADSQAPNAAAIKNARGVAIKKKLVGLFRSTDGTLLFGDCKSRGAENYRPSADFSDPTKPASGGSRSAVLDPRVDARRVSPTTRDAQNGEAWLTFAALNQVSQTTGSGCGLGDDISQYGLQCLSRKSGQMHHDVSNGTVIGNRSEEASPQLASRLEQPGFEFKTIRRFNHVPIIAIGKLRQPVQGDEFRCALDQLLGQQLPGNSRRRDN